MKALLQRVARAHVEVEGEKVGEISGGLLVLLCVERGDTFEKADRLLAKLLKLRLFSDALGSLNLCVQDVKGGLLIVSQFTLAANVSRGNRLSFAAAAPAEESRCLYEHFVVQARLQHAAVATGQFGADMQVHSVNDGPVTISLQF